MEPTIIEMVSKADKRGFSIKPFEGKQLNAVFNIHIVSLNPGTTRGNHFHPTQTEHIFVLGKQGTLATIDCATDKRNETVINGEKCPHIVVPPKVAHAIKNTGSDHMYLLCYTDSPVIPERDVIKKVILK